MGAQPPLTPTLGLLVSCEHASRDLPLSFGTLGLDPEVLNSHVAWDEGAREVALRVGERFSVPLHLGRFSRLLVDLNRSPDSIEAVPARAFGVDVPMNTGLDQASIATRIHEVHRPYWNAVERDLIQLLASHSAVLHLSVHSFTDVYQGQRRDLDLGILFDPDRPLEDQLSKRLKTTLSKDFEVRANEPYDGRADALTTALRKKLPAERYAGIEIEISHRRLNDLERIGDRLIAALTELRSTPQ